MLDLLICNVPGTTSYSPMAAPAILKAVAINAGFSARTIDFNARFYHQYHGSDEFDNLVNYFTENLAAASVHHKAKQLVTQWVSEIMPHQPRYVGLSVFTYQCRRATELFCAEIRKQLPTTRIVLGGQGILDGGINGDQHWIQRMRAMDLFDHWVKSEGERSIVNLLQDRNLSYEINEFDIKQIQNLDSIPWPDYSDYEFDLYRDKFLPITGSRGCVRACTFCDIHTHWKKFTFRSGTNVASEMIHQAAAYGIRHFQFTDSLVNGNLKQYKQFVTALADHNHGAADPITWSGQFIIRRQLPGDENMWQLTAQAGARKLSIGIESGSEAVRKHIGKEFSNQDIDHAVSLMHDHGITCTFLMLIGYPTETKQDFEDTIQMFKRLAPYAKRTIWSVELGSTLGILPNTPLVSQAERLGLQLDPRHENFWICHTNPQLTFKERLRRRFVLKQTLLDLDYQIMDGHDVMLQQLWQQHKNSDWQTGLITNGNLQ